MAGTDSSLMHKNLYSERLFPDVKFKVEGEVIPAHKGVLSAISTYFKNMFTSLNLILKKTDLIRWNDGS